MGERPGGETGGLLSALKNIAATLLASGRTRLELLSNEIEEGKLRVIELGMLDMRLEIGERVSAGGSPEMTESETDRLATARHEQHRIAHTVPEELRGTYAGLASPAMVSHLRRLGVTAVKLLPVHGFLDERHLIRRGLTNYWGYNTLSFFAPEPRYASRADGQSTVNEFRSMVRSLHAAGGRQF